MHTAYLSLGSNIGDRVQNLRTCISQLDELGKVKRVSSFYESEPMEFRDQPWFVNCVVELETELNPFELLEGIQSIEAYLGRNRVIEKGPRTIDIDILLFDELVFEDGQLQIPHPAMHKRRFVLVPLTEIARHVVHPSLKQTAEQLLSRLDPDGNAVSRLTT